MIVLWFCYQVMKPVPVLGTKEINFYYSILAKSRDKKKGGKKVTWDLNIRPREYHFIQQLVGQNRYQHYEDKYTAYPQERTEDNIALELCGCGCGITAAGSEHSCGCCQHKIMGFCIDDGGQGFGSKGLCFRCWKNHKNEVDDAGGMLCYMI